MKLKRRILFKEKIVLIENNIVSFQKNIHPNTSTKIANVESNLSVLPPPGQELVLTDNIHPLQGMTACTPTEKYMYTVLNQNMKIV